MKDTLILFELFLDLTDKRRSNLGLTGDYRVARFDSEFRRKPSSNRSYFELFIGTVRLSLLAMPTVTIGTEADGRGRG